MIALIDIDGVLADCSHRIGFIEGDVKRWDAFYDAMDHDTPFSSMCRFVCSISGMYDIIYLTGRPEAYREKTLDWLSRYGLPVTQVYMRSDGDYRPDYKVKKEIYKTRIMQEHGRAEVVIEDRGRVVQMWREMGILCLQPKDGDY